MKKVFKILIALLILGVFLGASTTVYINHKKEQRKKQEEITLPNKTSYKINRKNNKYTLTSNKETFKNKKITNIFYDDRNIYLYLEDQNNSTILKYNIETNKIKILYEDNTKIKGGIKELGNYYIINNKIYDKTFKEYRDYPQINNNELLYPNLKYKLIKTDNGIIRQSLIDNTNEEYLTNENFDLFTISDDNKTIILKEQEEEKTYLVYLNNKGNTNRIDIDYNEKNNYKLLTNKYLLEEKIEDNKKENIIYDIRTSEVVFSTNNNSIYNKIDVIYKDNNNNNIILKNYVTQEEKVLLNNKKEVNKFICSSDYFSVVIHFEEDKNSFYLIYL